MTILWGESRRMGGVGVCCCGLNPDTGSGFITKITTRFSVAFRVPTASSWDTFSRFFSPPCGIVQYEEAENFLP